MKTNSEPVEMNIINEATFQDGSIRKIFSFEAIFPNKEYYIMDPLFSYKAVADPDAMHIHHATKERDKDDVIEVIRKERKDQPGNGNFSIIL